MTRFAAWTCPRCLRAGAVSIPRPSQAIVDCPFCGRAFVVRPISGGRLVVVPNLAVQETATVPALAEHSRKARTI